MLGDNEDEVVMFAPISGDTRFVEFKIQFKTRKGPASSWSLLRTVVDRVPAAQQHLVAGFPVGAQYQEKAPYFLRNLTIIDSRAPGSSRYKQEHGDVYFDLLSPLLREMGVGHVYVATSSSTSIQENAASFSASGTVVILGGDTSAHEFVNALQPVHNYMTNEMRLVIIPTGTGNALANSIGLSTPLSAVRRLFLAKSVDFVPLSAFPVHFPHLTEPKHALVVASWGFHSALVADSDAPEVRERFQADPNERFKEAARINLETVHQEYQGSVSGGAEFGPTLSYLLFTTVTNLESTFCISPHSHPPSSDELHMIAIKPFESLEAQSKQLMEIMMEVYDNGSHIKDPRVTYVPVKSAVRVAVRDGPEKMRRWCVDGQTIVCPPGDVDIRMPTHTVKGWELKILPGAS